MKKISVQLLSLSLLMMPALSITVPHGSSIAAILVFILSLIVLINKYPFRWQLNKREIIFIFSLLFFPIVIACDVFFRELRFHYFDYYLRFILVIPTFLVLKISTINSRTLFVGIIIGAIGAGIIALYQQKILNMQGNIHGFILKINFGNLSLLLGMMSLSGLFFLKEVRYKKVFFIFCLTACLLGIIGSVLSGARGGWLAIPFFVSLFLIYIPANKLYKSISLVMSILIVIGMYYSSSYIKQRVDAVYTNVSHYLSTDKLIDTEMATQTSSGSRLEMWKAAWLIFKEHPVFGVGSGNYNQAFIGKMEAGEVVQMQVFEHAHSEPLHILAITGIVGFLSYLILYTGIAYYFLDVLLTTDNTQEKFLSFLGTMLVGGFFIFGLTNYSFGHQVMVLFFAVMVASFAGIISSIESKDSSI